MIRIDGQLYDRATIQDLGNRMSSQLGLDTDVKRRYALCFGSTIEWLSLFFAIRKSGASVLPIHPSTPYSAARRLAETAQCERLIYRNYPEEKLIPSESPSSTGQLLQMSSGTTGAAKCIARDWTEIDCEVETYVKTFREPDTMTPVIACPTTHSYGLICGILVALARGQVPTLVDTGNPKHLLAILRDTERPLLYSSPAILHTLSRLLPEKEKLYATMTSGTLLPEPWFARIREKSQHMFQQYGCSETGCIAINPDVRASDEMGFVLPHHAAITGNSRETASEIIIQSRDGRAINTRDLGYQRADGMLVFMSRMDDMINVSGLNVYPKDVEDTVMAMATIRDAVAFRKADQFAGERVVLLYSASQSVPPKDIRDWCSNHLASHQLPSDLVQVEEIPRQANGKINRRDIAAQYEAGKLIKRSTGATL